MATEAYGIRQVASACVAVVAVVIGLPLWWKTTEVYRANLPYSDIVKLRSQLENIKFKVNVTVSSPSMEHSHQLIQLLNSELQTLSQNVNYENMKIAYNIQQQGSGFIILDSTVKAPHLSVNQLLVPFDVENLQESIVHVQSILETLVIVPQELSSFHQSLIKEKKTSKKEPMRVLKSSRSYRLSFTLLVADPNECNVHWNIDEIITDLLEPLLADLKDVSFSNFSVESQVHYYPDLHLPVRQKDSYKTVRIRDLPEAISRLEAKLASHITQDPDVHFLIYIPKADEYPLKIVTTKGTISESNSFLIQQWGGLVVYNSPKMNTSQKHHDLPMEIVVDVRKVMPVFLTQFKALLGIPDISKGRLCNVQLPELPPYKLADWQIDRLLRFKVLENLFSSMSALTSLVGLLDKVKNMVISDEIQHLVTSSVTAFHQCLLHVENGDLHKGHVFSVESLTQAEKAFFDQSILELLYFPDDQKYGIYVPLFVPISVPIILSALRALKWLKRL